MTDSEEVVNATDPVIDQARQKAESDAEIIESHKTHVLKDTENAAKALASAQESAQASKGHLEQAKTAMNEVNALLAKVKTHSDEILALLSKSKTDSAATAEIARIANEKDAEVKEYQSELKDLIQKYEDTAAQIESLLPAATATGLAKAFQERKKSFTWPIRGTLFLFLLSILGFLILGIVAFNDDSIRSFSDFVLYALRRSPIIAGLILLEEFSRRHYKTLRKLEEDYAYKETISRTFEGYRDAMQKIPRSEGSPVETLSDNVLDAIAQPPGRLYEGEDDKKLFKKKEGQ